MPSSNGEIEREIAVRQLKSAFDEREVEKYIAARQ